MPGERKTRLIPPMILLIEVVTDGKLCRRLLLIGLINQTDITAPEDRPLLAITRDRELWQIQLIPLVQRQRKDKRHAILIRDPLFLVRFPLKCREPADHLPEFRLNQDQGVGHVVAESVEFLNGEVVL